MDAFKISAPTGRLVLLTTLLRNQLKPVVKSEWENLLISRKIPIAWIPLNEWISPMKIP